MWTLHVFLFIVCRTIGKCNQKEDLVSVCPCVSSSWFFYLRNYRIISNRVWDLELSQSTQERSIVVYIGRCTKCCIFQFVQAVGYGPDNRSTVITHLAEANAFSLSHKVQTGRGACHPDTNVALYRRRSTQGHAVIRGLGLHDSLTSLLFMASRVNRHSEQFAFLRTMFLSNL